MSSAPPEAEAPSAEGEPTETAPRRRSKWVRWGTEWLIVIALALVAALVLRTYVFQTFFIPSASMEPTLQVGDRIIVSKLSVELGTIHRGDIIVFKRPPAEDCGGPQVDDLVKRVIGLPGDELYSFKNTIYWRLGDTGAWHVLKQPWTHLEPLGQPIGTTTATGQPLTWATVPPNNYYMLGDNEQYSCDSRYWGTIPRSLVVGKVIFRIWPFSRIGFL